MKHRALILLVIIILLLSIQAVRAAGTGYTLDWWTVDGGGGTSQGAGYSLTGTVGQADAGTMHGADYTLGGGFWSWLQEIWEKIFLPLVLRS